MMYRIHMRHNYQLQVEDDINREFHILHDVHKCLHVHDVHVGEDFVSVRLASAKYPSIWVVAWTTGNDSPGGLGRTLAIVQRRSKICICRQLGKSQAAISCQVYGQPEPEIVSTDVFMDKHSNVYPGCVLHLVRRSRGHCSSIAS